MQPTAARSITAVPVVHPAQRQTQGRKFGGLAALSASPIEFYGKVIDEGGKPLSGVEVIGSTGSTTGFMQQETRSYTTATDANGLFSFQGFRGDALIIELKKGGYNFASDQNRFHYSPIDPDKKRFVPDRERPVLFRMWKSIGAEPLINYYGRSVRISPDGTPVAIDLKKGAKTNGEGDLLVSVVWGPHRDPGSYAFDWSAKLEVPTGGILESTGDVMFLAPSEGYENSLEYHFSAHEKRGDLKRTFYIRSRNGTVFSRVEISLQNNPIDGDVSATLRVQLNPRSGSRNLEQSKTQVLTR